MKGYPMEQGNDDRVSEVLALFFRCLYGILPFCLLSQIRRPLDRC